MAVIWDHNINGPVKIKCWGGCWWPGDFRWSVETYWICKFPVQYYITMLIKHRPYFIIWNCIDVYVSLDLKLWRYHIKQCISWLLFVYISPSWWRSIKQLDSLVQDCSNSIANALELLQSCTKPSSIYSPTVCPALPRLHQGWTQTEVDSVNVYIILLYGQTFQSWQVSVSVGVAKEVHSDLWQCLGAKFC